MKGGSLTQCQMCDDAAKYEGGEEGQGDDEAVEVAVVAFAHTVPHPRTVVVESLWGNRQRQDMRSMQTKVTLGHVKIGFTTGSRALYKIGKGFSLNLKSNPHRLWVTKFSFFLRTHNALLTCL